MRAGGGVRLAPAEGAGSYGAGVAAHLAAAGERVVEFDHPVTAAAADGAKSNARGFTNPHKFAARTFLITLPSDRRRQPTIPQMRAA